MTTPLDPSEPLYPIRLNEPVCQYYMKHGTCKFAQACKFHHPPQQARAATSAMNNGAVLMMNVGGRQVDASQTPQGILIGNDGKQPMSTLQFLPQRPDEPDCIFFLKNGRCKYGVTCRYHHPLNYHQHRAEEQRRHHEMRRVNMAPPDRYYVAHQAISSSIPQGHVFLPDNPVAVVSLDHRDTASGLQQFSLMGRDDGSSSLCVPISSGTTVGTAVTEQGGSSASSIASSYDTAPAAEFQHQDGSSSSWNRRSSFSVATDVRQGRAMRHSASDGNISRRNRALSQGSASDSFFESTLRRNESSGSWQQQRVHDYDTLSPLQYSQDSGLGEQQLRPAMRLRPPGLGGPQVHRNAVNSRRGAHQQRPGDEGFTMMTSALLNMLDTTEEGALEGYSDDDNHEGLAPPAVEVDPAMFERLSLGPSNGQDFHHRSGEETEDHSWSPPTWQVNRPRGTLQEPEVGMYFP